MKKLSVVVYITAALTLLLGNLGGSSSAGSGQAVSGVANGAAGEEGILAIPAAAFTPFEDGYDFENHGPYLIHQHSPGGGTANGWYLAPVQLPDGAVVTKMTFYFKDSWIFYDGIARLQRTHLGQGNFQEMASVDTSGAASGYTSKSTTAISGATIDNNSYAYWVIWDIPYTASQYSRFEGCGVILEYGPSATVTSSPSAPTVLVNTVSFPAAAFRPFEDGYDYQNHGRYLFTKAGASGPYGWYLAQVLLPQGAKVSEMTFHWYDGNVLADGIARLQRTEYGQGNYVEMAAAATTGSGGYQSSTDDTVAYNIIDNSKYAYWIVWDLPAAAAEDLRGCGVVLKYAAPASVTGVISIPAAAFGVPGEDGYDFQDHGRYLIHQHSPGAGTQNGVYLAPLQLPHGVTVTKMTFHWYDNNDSVAGTARLRRTRLGQGTWGDMAATDTNSSLPYAFGSNSVIKIGFPAIDDSQYAYWLRWDLPVATSATHPGQGDVLGCGVVIEYAFRVHLPMILKEY